MVVLDEKVQNECCDLELAQKFKVLGIKQESLFCWISGGCPEEWYLSFNGSFSKPYHLENLCAFTATELIELIPKYIDTKKNEPFNGFIFNLYMSTMVEDTPHRVYFINYQCDTMQFDTGSPWFGLKLFKHNVYDKKLSNALAKTLIYLIENNLITL